MRRKTTAKKVKRAAVSKPEYQKFIKGLSLNELKIVALNASAKPEFGVPASLNIRDESILKFSEGNKFRIVQKYSLKSKKKGDKEVGFIVEVTYVLSYTTEIPITDAHFQIFRKSSLRLQTWSYFRQLVHQLSMYMNLPPLILDVMEVTS
jgi:preprotein translocase subunit SecB